MEDAIHLDVNRVSVSATALRLITVESDRSEQSDPVAALYILATINQKQKYNRAGNERKLSPEGRKSRGDSS